MPKHVDYFIEKTLGKDFLGDLAKTEIYKIGTRSVVDEKEIALALQVVPRTILSFLIRHLAQMQVGDHKDIILPVPNTMLRVDKVERDCYNGQIEQDNKKIAEFINRPMPGIALYLLSTLELYSIEDLEKPAAIDQNMGDTVQKLVDERLALHDLIGQVVDKKIQQKDAVNLLMLSKLTADLEKEKEAAEHARVQLAGCGVAALGYAKGNNGVKPGDYGHSASFDDVKRLREEHDKLKSDIANVIAIAKDPGNAGHDEYMRGMANGLEVANSAANKKEPEFVNPPKTIKLKQFLESRKAKQNKPKEFHIEIAKSEKVACPDCGKEIFSGDGIYSSCICFGDSDKIFIRKTEKGVAIRFPKNWEIENIEMLLETLRKRHG